MYVLKIHATCGALLRGNFKRELREVCWKRDIECDIQEEKDFLSSTFFITLRHPNKDQLKAIEFALSSYS